MFGGDFQPFPISKDLVHHPIEPTIYIYGWPWGSREQCVFSCPKQRGTLPVILSLIPLALTGSFYLRRDESEVCSVTKVFRSVLGGSMTRLPRYHRHLISSRSGLVLAILCDLNELTMIRLPKTNIFAPENGWLEDFLVSFWGPAYFHGLC